MKSLSVQDLYKHFPLPAGALILDVRTPEEYASGHVEGARLAPLDALASFAALLEKESSLYVICRSGGRSQAACGLLDHLGFKDVTNIEGGILAWSAAGYALI